MLRAVVFLALCAVLCSSSKSATPYIVVIDAGSSGSRVHVFEPLESQKQDGLPGFKLPQPSLKEKPGLSSFADHPEDAGPSLARLISFAKERIPETEWKNTQLLVAATAGLRRIPKEKADKILENCRAYLVENSPFSLLPSYPQLMSGKDEGAMGWLAANYLSSSVSPLAPAVFNAVAASSSSKPKAVLELGGASAQVTLALPETDDTSYEKQLLPFDFGKKKYKLYTHSYLNFGQEAAREHYNGDLLVASPSNAVALISPPSASSSSSDSSSVSSVEDVCLPRGFDSGKRAKKTVFSGPASGLKSSVAVKVVGRGDYSQCREAVLSSLFKEPLDVPCPVKKCSFGGIAQPSLNDHELLAFENFFYTTEGLGLLDSFSVRDLDEKGAEFCAAGWEDLVKKHGEEDAERWCFAVAYSSVFLENGLGINREKTIEVRKKINGIDIDWALGLAVATAVRASHKFGSQLSDLAGFSDSDAVPPLRKSGDDSEEYYEAEESLEDPERSRSNFEAFTRWIYGGGLFGGVLAVSFVTFHKLRSTSGGFAAVQLEDLSRADLKSV